MPNGFLTYDEEWGDVDDCGFRLLSLRKAKAKKEHICSGCQGFISIGEVYTKEAFVTEYGFGTEKRHDYDCCSIPAKCAHIYDKDEPIRNWEGAVVGSTKVCSKCGITAFAEDMEKYR